MLQCKLHRKWFFFGFVKGFLSFYVEISELKIFENFYVQKSLKHQKAIYFSILLCKWIRYAETRQQHVSINGEKMIVLHKTNGQKYFLDCRLRPN